MKKITNEPVHEISNNVVCATSKASDQPAHMRNLIIVCQSLEYFMKVKLLTEHHLELLGLKVGCRGSSESTHVKMLHCWKSHATALVMEAFDTNSVLLFVITVCLNIETLENGVILVYVLTVTIHVLDPDGQTVTTQ